MIALVRVHIISLPRKRIHLWKRGGIRMAGGKVNIRWYMRGQSRQSALCSSDGCVWNCETQRLSTEESESSATHAIAWSSRCSAQADFSSIGGRRLSSGSSAWLGEPGALRIASCSEVINMCAYCDWRLSTTMWGCDDDDFERLGADPKEVLTLRRGLDSNEMWWTGWFSTWDADRSRRTNRQPENTNNNQRAFASAPVSEMAGRSQKKSARRRRCTCSRRGCSIIRRSNNNVSKPSSSSELTLL